MKKLIFIAILAVTTTVVASSTRNSKVTITKATVSKMCSYCGDPFTKTDPTQCPYCQFGNIK